MKNGNGQIQSLDRAFTLIDIITNASEPLALKTITQLANLPKPTVYRILSSLESWNYVEQDKDKGYKLGTKFLLLGNKVQDSFEIRTVAHPFLEELNRETKETVFLGINKNGRSLYIDKIDSSHSVRLVSGIGSRNYLHSTSLGKALLVGSHEQEVRAVLTKHGMPPKTEKTLTNQEDFLEQLDLIRQRGYALDDMENEDGVRCVAAPIRDYQGKVIAAISISGPAQRITDEAIENSLKEAVLRTVKKVSQALGYNG